MVSVIVVLAMLLGLPGHSDAANYCVCNSGVSDSALQKNIDYACGTGADCSPIQQNGACFNPNSVKDHCNYAVNSYYQRKGQATGSCDFQGTATVTPNPPNAGSGCVYQSNPSTGGVSNTPPTVGGTLTPPTVGGTPSPPTVGGTPSPPTIGGFNTPPGIFSPPGIPGTNPIGLAPSGTGTGFGSTTDGSSGVSLKSMSGVFTLLAICAAILSSSFLCSSA